MSRKFASNKGDFMPTPKVVTYGSLKEQVERPLRERAKMPIGRNGAEIKARRYHLKDKERRELIEYAHRIGREVINPHARRIGLYWGQVEALIQLGVNEWHAFGDVYKKIREIMEAEKNPKTGLTAWDRAMGRKTPAEAQNPQSLRGRIITNYRVLQRLPNKKERNPYGAKLAQFGMAVDIKYIKVSVGGVSADVLPPIPHYRLNTNWEPWDFEASPDSCHIVPISDNPYVKRGRKPKKAQEGL